VLAREGAKVTILQIVSECSKHRNSQEADVVKSFFEYVCHFFVFVSEVLQQFSPL